MQDPSPPLLNLRWRNQVRWRRGENARPLTLTLPPEYRGEGTGRVACDRGNFLDKGGHWWFALVCVSRKLWLSLTD